MRDGINATPLALGPIPDDEMDGPVPRGWEREAGHEHVSAEVRTAEGWAYRW